MLISSNLDQVTIPLGYKRFLKISTLFGHLTSLASFSKIREKWGFGDEIGGLIFPIFKQPEDMLKTIALATKKSKQNPKSFSRTFWDSC